MLPNVFWIVIMFTAALMGELITASIMAEIIEEGDREYMLAVAGDRLMIWLEQTVKSLLLIIAILSGFVLGGILHQMVMAVTLVVAIMTTARRSKMAFTLFLIVYLVNAIFFLKGVLPRLLPLIGAGLAILYIIISIGSPLDEEFFEEGFVEEESSNEVKNSKEESKKTKSSEKKPPKGGDPKPKLRPRSISADSDSEATAVAEESDEAESPFVVSISGSVITTIGLVILLIIILTVAIRILLSLSNI